MRAVESRGPRETGTVAAAGLLVALEGGEGVGKSTQAERLAASLGAVLAREPGGTPLGEAIRELLLARDGPRIVARAELLLFGAQRAAHMEEVILPALEAGEDVVVDRFVGSTLAYQAFGRGLPLEEVRVVCDIAQRGRWPDLSVLLVVPEEESRRRRGEATDRIEAADDAFHRRVREGFVELATADPARWVVVDGTGAPDDVAARVLDAVVRRFPERAPGWGSSERHRTTAR